MERKKEICDRCKKSKIIHWRKENEKLCNWCYRKTKWDRKKAKCSRCKRIIHIHAKGFCTGCYSIIFHLEGVRKHNAKKLYGPDLEIYTKITKSCVICGFDKIVDLHHLNHNPEDNSEINLVGLCPNHHKMILSIKYQKEVFNVLKEKGFNVPKGSNLDGFFPKIKKLKKDES
jgi:hypothetical protein